MRAVHFACIALWTSLIATNADRIIIGLGTFFLANAVFCLLDEIMENRNGKA